MNIVRKKRVTAQIRRWLYCLWALLLFTTVCLPVHAAESRTAETENSQENSQEEEILAPYFIIKGTNEDPSLLEHFPLKATNVVSNINGVIAETYVTQTYVNEGSIPINASYVFPANSNVAVHGMKMIIGNEMITARIQEKEEAKKEYEEAKSEGKSASLMEQKRPNVFTMDVANIMPGDTVSIELHYTELINPRENIYEFVFPTVVGPRYAAPKESGNDTSVSGTSDDDSVSDGDAGSTASDHNTGAPKDSDDDWVSSPYLEDGTAIPGDYNITVNLSTGVPIAEITSKSHDIRIHQENASTAQITLADFDNYAGNRDFILKYRLAGEEVHSGLVLSQGQEENFFMLTVQPPERYEPDDIPPREYIFVLDVSGSMFGYPLDTAKDLLKSLVKDLRETDSFNLILFANESVLLSPESLPATAQNIKAATRLIDEQKGGGGTSLLPALENAITIPKQENSARSIVIITDGYISNDSEVISCITSNMNDASFFSFGIGTSVNDCLIKQIAGCGMGESFIVTDSEDAAESASNFRAYIEAPLLTDISVTYKGFDVYDVETSTPSILYASRPIILFGKWRGTPKGTVTVTGQAGGEEYRQEITVEETASDTESEALRYLWARTRLDRVTGYGNIRNDESVKKEVVELGIKYNMVTPYTSFIAVSEMIRNPEGDSADVDQPLPLPQRVSGLAVGGGYRAYSEPGMLLLMVPAAAAIIIRKRRERHGASND